MSDLKRGTTVGGQEIITSSDIVSTTVNGVMTKEDKVKLNGIATSANNYVHPTTDGNKHIPSGGASGQVLRWSSAGTAVWGTDSNTTYGVVSKSANGLAPQLPNESTTTKYLRQDGTWVIPPDTKYTHPTGNGNTHIPANGSSNQWLKYSSAGTAVWSGLPSSTTSASGIVQLNDATNSTSTTTAATANAVKKVYDKANHSHPYVGTGGGSIAKGSSIVEPQGNFALKVINGVDNGTEHGLFVASRWGSNTSDAFRVSTMWNGGALKEDAKFKVMGDGWTWVKELSIAQSCQVHCDVNFNGIRKLKWSSGRPNSSEIFWNASADVDYGMIHKVDGQDVLVLKTDGINAQKVVYANAGVQCTGNLVVSSGTLFLSNNTGLKNTNAHNVHGTMSTEYDTSGLDANQLVFPNVYKGSGMKNVPAMQHGWCYLEVFTHAPSSWIMQRASCLHAGTEYQRILSDAGWGAWKKLTPTISTAGPSGGTNGDVWIKYS